MAILTHLIAYNVDLLDGTVRGLGSGGTSPSAIKWMPAVGVDGSGSVSYVADETIATATYVSGLCAGMAVVWGAAPGITYYPTSIISVTALRDDIPIYLSAVAYGSDTGSNTVSSSVFNPWHLAVAPIAISPLTATLSCFYQQVSTNDTQIPYRSYNCVGYNTTHTGPFRRY